MLDATTRQVLHRVLLGGTPLDVVVDGQRRHVLVVFERATWTKLSILDTHTGRVLRTVAISSFDGAMALARQAGLLFIGSTRGAIMLNTRSGRVIHTTPLGDAPTALAVSERAGRVYAVDAAASRVCVLDARTGAIKSAFRVVQDPVAVAVDNRTQRVFVASNDLSDGINSGITGGVRTSHVFASIAAILSNAGRLPRKGMTGSVDILDMRTMR